ncbi:hypothetical protein AVEN_119210-1 [Araneus ventricosus]|uniref:Uncharacterized protein n=1 Tax=Araneus ventricosus TaxID=182803 RepID=A0A4Y2NUZ7_ARAVE|nr:hypothetical protein AVEN_119210-1 [Araneus ventricosus]
MGAHIAPDLSPPNWSLGIMLLPINAGKQKLSVPNWSCQKFIDALAEETIMLHSLKRKPTTSSIRPMPLPHHLPLNNHHKLSLRRKKTHPPLPPISEDSERLNSLTSLPTTFQNLPSLLTSSAPIPEQKSLKLPRTVIVNDGTEPVRASITEDTSKLQKLYDNNKKRAIREIGKQQGNRCTIDVGTLYNHFSAVLSPTDPDETYYTTTEEHRVEVLDRKFTIGEVTRKLRNASPGPGRITYKH